MGAAAAGEASGSGAAAEVPEYEGECASGCTQFARPPASCSQQATTSPQPDCWRLGASCPSCLPLPAHQPSAVPGLLQTCRALRCKHAPQSAVHHTRSEPIYPPACRLGGGVGGGGGKRAGRPRPVDARAARGVPGGPAWLITQLLNCSCFAVSAPACLHCSAAGG